MGRFSRPRKKTTTKSTKTKTEEEKDMIKRVYQWVCDAIERERNGESVFQGNHEKSSIATELCGTLTQLVYKALKEEHGGVEKYPVVNKSLQLYGIP